MCFDGKKTTIWKKYKINYSNNNNEKISKESKIDFFWRDDVSCFVGSFIQIFVVIVVGPHH